MLRKAGGTLRSGPSKIASGGRKARTMKRIVGAAVVTVVAVALVAGKDDIRKFYRMYSM